MSSGLYTIAGRILDEQGVDALAAWEAKLTPQERRSMDEDWREFTTALRAFADAAKFAADRLTSA